MPQKNRPGEELRTRISGLISRRVVVFDDDPTGTQAVSGVTVVIDPTEATFGRFFESGDRALYVVTEQLGRCPGRLRRHSSASCTRTIDASAKRAGEKWVPLLRGDSTLRGHVFAEADALGARDAAMLFVPAFPEAGRYTVDGQQLVRIDDQLVNVADTEFARDPAFGYASRTLVEWVREVGGSRATRSLRVTDLRVKGASAIRDALLDLPDGGVLIPDAETYDDLRQVALGLLGAEGQGRRVVVRSSSSFAGLRCGLTGRLIATVAVSPPGRVLIVCGSHTQASTEQLQALAASGVSIQTVGVSRSPGRVARRLIDLLEHDRVAVIATPRRSRGLSPALGVQLMDALCSVVGRAMSNIDAIITKGGITAAEVMRTLGAGSAVVEGQLEPGVAIWSLPGRPAPFPMAVVPGNVGNAGTLLRVLGQFVGTETRTPHPAHIQGRTGRGW